MSRRQASLPAITALGIACASSVGACGAPPAPASPAPEAPAAALLDPAAAVSAAPSAAPSADEASPPPAPAPAVKEAPAVEVVVVAPSEPPASLPTVTITAPSKNQVIASAKAAAFEVKLKVDGLAAGDRACVRIDKRPCRDVLDPKKPMSLKELDPTIDDGQHVITAHVRRASGETVKPAGKRAAFASHSFFVGKKVPSVWKDGGPMVLFDPPPDGPAPEAGVLVDFYLANAELGRGKRTIHVSVGGPGLGPGTAMVLDKLAPLRIKNARAGEYLVRFTLFETKADLGESSSSTTVSFSAAQVTGPFAEVTRSFRVTAP